MDKKKNVTNAVKVENISVDEEPQEPTTTENEEQEETCINLAALDGYVLPNEEETDEEEGTDAAVAKPKKKRRRRTKKDILGDDYREKEERRLEELLFGDLLRNFEVKTNDSKPVEPVAEDSSESDGEVSQAPVPEVALPADVYGQNLLGTGTSGLKAAWVDEDDEETKLKDVVATYTRGKGNHGSKETSETNYREFLEKNFASIHGQVTPKWAELNKNAVKKKRKGSDDDTDEEDSDDYDDSTLTKTAANLLKRESSVLEKDRLKFKRVKDLNHQSRGEGAIIKSLEFHKKESVALVAGNAGVVSLFQVDGRTNAKIQSIKFKDFPLHQAQFAVNGEEFLATSYARGIVQVHNIVTGKNSIIPHNRAMEDGIYKDFVLSPDGRFIAFCGRFGYVHLLSARSKEWITSFKMNGDVHALTFSADSSRLYSHGEHGEVYIWDMQSRSCVNKFVDDGCILGTALAVSSSQQFLACGSSSGVVNVYSTDKLENTHLPKPDKILLNLVTRTSAVKFHPSSELMSMFSNAKENAVRLVHFPSMTVFQNFPQTPGGRQQADRDKKMSHVNSCDFSPNGGYMALGLNNGSAALYRLHHYDQY